MRYVARVAGKEHGDYLGCEESSPVLLLEQVIRLDDETPIEWSFTWLKAGRKWLGTVPFNPHNIPSISPLFTKLFNVQ